MSEANGDNKPLEHSAEAGGKYTRRRFLSDLSKIGFGMLVYPTVEIVLKTKDELNNPSPETVVEYSKRNAQTGFVFDAKLQVPQGTKEIDSLKKDDVLDLMTNALSDGLLRYTELVQDGNITEDMKRAAKELLYAYMATLGGIFIGKVGPQEKDGGVET